MLGHNSKYVVYIVALVIIYTLSARLGLMLAFDQDNTSPVWPPTGIAIAALLFFGKRLWPGIFIGALLINWYIGSAAPLAFAIATGNTLEAVVAAYLITRYASPFPFFKVREAVLFLVILCVATMISASVGVGSLYVVGMVNNDALASLWNTWWLGDLVGGLVFTPFLLTWYRLPKEAYSRAQLIEGGFLLSIVCLLYTSPSPRDS